jgi:GT2 family glycosyltransferase
LVVPTLNREDVLLRSLEANVGSTRAPAQIIVVDANESWQRARDRVMNNLAPKWPKVEWIYLPSDIRSATHQRNFGLARCTSDVAFLLDDDSFMYHDCAEEIMRIYENDPREEIGGVCAWLADGREGSPAPSAPHRNELVSRLVRVLERQWWQDKLFIPYDGEFHARNVKADGADVVPLPLFHGCRMTFRMGAIRRVGGFEEMLVGAAYGEDCDLSYRISRRQALVGAPNAKLFHDQERVAHSRRELNTALVLLNAIALYKLNAPHGRRASWIVYKHLVRRAALEVFRDCLRPRRWMPHTTGVMRAARFVPAVLASEPETLRREYVGIQNRLRQQG